MRNNSKKCYDDQQEKECLFIIIHCFELASSWTRQQTMRIKRRRRKCAPLKKNQFDQKEKDCLFLIIYCFKLVYSEYKQWTWFLMIAR